MIIESIIYDGVDDLSVFNSLVEMTKGLELPVRIGNTRFKIGYAAHFRRKGNKLLADIIINDKAVMDSVGVGSLKGISMKEWK